MIKLLDILNEITIDTSIINIKNLKIGQKYQIKTDWDSTNGLKWVKCKLININNESYLNRYTFKTFRQNFNSMSFPLDHLELKIKNGYIKYG